MIKLILLLGEFYFQCFNFFFFKNCFLHVVIILYEYFFPLFMPHEELFTGWFGGIY